MADKKFTLLELHLEGDTQFGPKVIGGEETPDEAGAETGSGGAGRSETVDESGISPGSVLKALAVVGVMVFVVRRLARRFGGVPEDLPERIEIGADEIESAAD